MLDPADRRAIEGLFDRLRDVAQKNPDRDPEAEALIRSEMAQAPGAAYYMAQTVLVQESALEAAQRRIAELEEETRRRPAGGLFDSIFGDGGRQTQRPREPQRQVYSPPPEERGATTGPWDRQPQRRQSGGGGFLAGAAQTALGVTGGVLLGSAIAGMLGGGAAQAAETDGDAGHDGGGDDGGGDSGGDFDIGGDF